VILKQKENSWRYTGLPTRVYTGIMKWLMGSPDVVISPSQFLLDFYEKRGFFRESKRIVLRNPVTVFSSVISTEAPPAAHSAKDDIEKKNMNVLYLGQIEEHKGVLFLLQAFKKFPNKRAVFTIAGSGSLLHEIQTDPSLENIHVIGKVDREDLLNLFAETDVLIVPSLCYENSPTVIFEAFSYGVPVLASRVEGVSELIKEGENGLTFETGEEQSLFEKITWCFEHRDELREMSKKTVQSLLGLSQSEYIARLENLYAG